MQESGIRDGRDVLEYSVKRIHEVIRNNRHFSFASGQISRGDLGGVSFYALPTTWTVEGIEIRQFLYCKVIDNYALFLNTTFHSNAERQTGRELTASIRFD